MTPSRQWLTKVDCHPLRRVGFFLLLKVVSSSSTEGVFYSAEVEVEGCVLLVLSMNRTCIGSAHFVCGVAPRILLGEFAFATLVGWKAASLHALY